MKRLFKVLLALVVLAVLAALGGVGYVMARYPDVPEAETITVEATPERLARGQYLVEHVTVCIDCHSQRDMTKYAGPVKPGTEGGGGEFFGDEAAGLRLYSRNITPAGIGEWTDGELIRAMTTGVNPSGEALFPIMPYQRYASLDTEDVQAIVAYIRTLKPVTSHVPERELPFPLPLVVRTMPAAARPQARPSPDDRWRDGRYLVNAAACGDCHSPMDDQGQIIAGREFSGGMEFPLPGGGVVRSANISPDRETGIGAWTEEQFVQKFKAFEHWAGEDLSAAEQRENTVMPWLKYAGMTEQDLRAVYNYLRFLPPVRNRVTKFN
ncbi:MAG: cytochrome C [Vicinamibacterales bacterium]